MNNSFIMGEARKTYPLIIITGASRSGKTLLSKLLSSTEGIEWIEEPFSLITIVEMHGMGLLDDIAFQQLFYSITHETIIDNILLRNGNFRPNDLSSIWNVKSAKEIFSRINSNMNRDEIDHFIDENNIRFIFDLTETFPFVDNIRKIYPNVCVIHVVRNAYDVASEIEKKKWFSNDSLKGEFPNYLFRDKIDELKIPWWVDKNDIAEFVTTDEFNRGLLYWTQMVSNLSVDFERKKIESQYDILVRYEDLTLNPQKIIDDIKRHIKVVETNRTYEIIKSIYHKKIELKNIKIKNNKFRKLMEMYGYQ